MVVCLAREDMYFCALWWERKVISAGEMAGGRVSFSDTTVYMSKIRVQFYGKVAPAGCTQSIFRLNRVKTSVDQSARRISRWIKMGTLLCRQMARVHPVVSFTKKTIPNKWRTISLWVHIIRPHARRGKGTAEPFSR